MIDSDIQNYSYAGEVTCNEAFHLLKTTAAAVMVDVRTPEEWAQVGIADLSSIGKTPIRLSWRLLPSMQINSDFTSEFRKQVPDNVPVFFMCKVGGRSRDAAIAMTAEGYTHCYNIAGGFEGYQGNGQYVEGWKSEQLPWRQI